MSIGDAVPAASASVALPARTITITKGDDTHFINCQLHVAPLPAADYGTPASPYRELGLSRKLPTQSTQEEVADFGFDLYWEVLAPFSDVIVVFVAGIGPLRTADILQRWARSPLTVSRFSPHILVTEGNEDPRLEKVLDTFIRNPRRKLRVSKLIRRSRVSPAISILAEQSNNARIKLELNFAHRHRCFFVQTSLQHFCDNLPLPDFVTASRLANPVPPSAEYHLQKVVKAFSSHIAKLTRLIASALVLDAFPPGCTVNQTPYVILNLPLLTLIADFRPKDVFPVIYRVRHPPTHPL
jgi:hypothetical protein